LRKIIGDFLIRIILSPEIARKLAQLACINDNLDKLNESEPLPPEFDEIIAQRVNFSRVLDI